MAAHERSCFFGRTGSGKTTLARALLREAGYFTVLDPKWDYRQDAVPIVSEFDPDLPQQIVRVEPDESEPERWDAVINACWERAPDLPRESILYVDEATLITPPTRLRPSLGKAIRTGRSRGLGVWTASQRPKDLPSAIFTEAEHFFVFRLTWLDDRVKVAHFTADGILPAISRIRAHDFVYYDVLLDRQLNVRATRGV